MKLLYVAPAYPPMVDGGERLVQALAEQATAALVLADNGWVRSQG